jgi:hypothetical protein
MDLGTIRDYYDINDRGVQNDLCSVIGFFIALRGILKVRRGGLLWGGVPCGPFVFISSGTTKRTRANPEGDGAVECVRIGNVLAARFCLLALVGICRGVWFCVEQPASSVMPYFPPMKALLDFGDMNIMQTFSTRLWSP